MKRREFLKKAGVGTAAVVGAGAALSTTIVGCGKGEKEEVAKLKSELEACKGKLATITKKKFKSLPNPPT